MLTSLNRSFPSIFAVMLLLVAMPPSAEARPQYAERFKEHLASAKDDETRSAARSVNCNTCHVAGKPKTERNRFGKSVQEMLGDSKNVKDQHVIDTVLSEAARFAYSGQKKAKGPAAALRETATIEAIDVPLIDVLAVLGFQHNVRFIFDEVSIYRAGLSSDVEVSAALTGISLKSVLSLVLSQVGMTYVIRDDVIAILPAKTPRAAPKAENVKANRDRELLVALTRLKGSIGKTVNVECRDKRYSGALLKVSGKEKLEGVTLFSLKSTNNEFFIPTIKMVSIRIGTDLVYPSSNERATVRRDSQEAVRRLEARERAARQARSVEAERIRGERRRAWMKEQLAARASRRSVEPIDASEAVRALGQLILVVGAAAVVVNAIGDGIGDPPQTSGESMQRKAVELQYPKQPIGLEFGVTIRYDTDDPTDPGKQEGSTNNANVRFTVPLDVRSVRIVSGPFASNDGTHRLESRRGTLIYLGN